MNCEHYLDLISGHLDGCNSEAEEIELSQHLAQCEACGTLLRQLEENRQLFAGSTVQPPEDLQLRIMDAVKKEPKKASKKRFYTSFVAGGLAAAALLALVFLGGNRLPVFVGKDSTAEAAIEPYGMEDFDAPCDMSAEDHPSKSGNYHIAATESPAETALETGAAIDEGAADSTDCSTAPTREQPKLVAGDVPLFSRYGGSGLVTEDGSLYTMPTMIIQGATTTDFPGLDMGLSVLVGQSSAAAKEDSFYSRFFSVLPEELRLTPIPQDAPDYRLSQHLVSYDSFCALLEVAAGSYEAAVYLPEALPEDASGLSCLIILICEE